MHAGRLRGRGGFRPAPWEPVAGAVGQNGLLRGDVGVAEVRGAVGGPLQLGHHALAGEFEAPRLAAVARVVRRQLADAEAGPGHEEFHGLAGLADGETVQGGPGVFGDDLAPVGGIGVGRIGRADAAPRGTVRRAQVEQAVGADVGPGLDLLSHVHADQRGLLRAAVRGIGDPQVVAVAGAMALRDQQPPVAQQPHARHGARPGAGVHQDVGAVRLRADAVQPHPAAAVAVVAPHIVERGRSGIAEPGHVGVAHTPDRFLDRTPGLGRQHTQRAAFGATAGGLNGDVAAIGARLPGVQRCAAAGVEGGGVEQQAFRRAVPDEQPRVLGSGVAPCREDEIAAPHRGRPEVGADEPADLRGEPVAQRPCRHGFGELPRPFVEPSAGRGGSRVLQPSVGVGHRAAVQGLHDRYGGIALAGPGEVLAREGHAHPRSGVRGTGAGTKPGGWLRTITSSKRTVIPVKPFISSRQGRKYGGRVRFTKRPSAYGVRWWNAATMRGATRSPDGRPHRTRRGPRAWPPSRYRPSSRGAASRGTTVRGPGARTARAAR